MTRTFHTAIVIPAQAGAHLHKTRNWVPAFAGMKVTKKRTTP